MAVASVTLSAGSGLLFLEVPELSGFVVWVASFVGSQSETPFYV